MTFPAFKAGDSFLRGSNGGFDSHTPPPSFLCFVSIPGTTVGTLLRSQLHVINIAVADGSPDPLTDRLSKISVRSDLRRFREFCGGGTSFEIRDRVPKGRSCEVADRGQNSMNQ